MQVVLLMGFIPPIVCGICDYAIELHRELRRAGMDAEIVNGTDWSPLGWLRTVRQLRRSDVIHVQHPTVAMGKRVSSYFLFFGLFGRRRVVTFHEFSRKKTLGKLLSYPLIKLANLIIVTNRAEYDAIGQKYPSVRDKLKIVPIGSNIPVAPAAERTIDVVYFGRIRVGWGVEQFLDVIERLKPGRSVTLMGSIAGADSASLALAERAKSLGVDLVFDAPAEEVARVLARSKVALLPFPDGITERRGSALAAMANGAVVVANSHPDERDMFAPICLQGDSIEAMTRLTERVLAGDEDIKERVRKAEEYVSSRSWASIARTHRALYTDLCAPPRRQVIEHRGEGSMADAEM